MNNIFKYEIKYPFIGHAFIRSLHRTLSFLVSVYIKNISVQYNGIAR
jgi:hypothetical protein